MTTLYYNPIELPSKIKIVSKCFNIDIEYQSNAENMPVYIDELFNLAKCESFDEVAVFSLHTKKHIYEKIKVLQKKILKGGFH